jgi:hypothetical protein
VGGYRIGREQPAKIIHANDGRSNFQKRILLRIESASFHVHNHWQKTPESVCNARHNAFIPAYEPPRIRYWNGNCHAAMEQKSELFNAYI